MVARSRKLFHVLFSWISLTVCPSVTNFVHFLKKMLSKILFAKLASETAAVPPHKQNNCHTPSLAIFKL